MKVITNKEVREVEVRTYISDDGKEFVTEYDCREYEKEKARLDAYKSIIDLLVYDDNTAKIPCDGGENYENRVWEWYKVENKEQLERLNNFFNTDARVGLFPEFICIERELGDDEGYSQTLTGCIDYVERFFRDFGYKVEITKV